MTRLALAALASLTLAGPAFAGNNIAVGYFDSVGLSGGGHVVLRQGPVQRVTILKGSTQYTRIRVRGDGNLEIDACNWSCPHNYDLEVEIVTPNLHGLAVDGGGEMESAGGFGKVDKLDVAVNGGGELHVRSIAANKVSAAVSGGGELEVTALGSLSAEVSGGGDITYWGHPQLSTAISGGGEVHGAE